MFAGIAQQKNIVFFGLRNLILHQSLLFGGEHFISMFSLSFQSQCTSCFIQSVKLFLQHRPKIEKGRRCDPSFEGVF